MKEINMSRTFTRCVGDNSARPSSMLRLRLRGPSGTATGSFDGAASIESFLVAASEQLGCAGAKIDMLVGFPPKQCEVSGAPLSSVVGSGDTVVLNVLAAPAPAPAPAAAPAPGSAGPTPALGGMWACGACTLENEAVASACVACETPRPGGGAGKAQLQKMADDNSCLFHAVAYCLNISSSPAQVGGSGLGVGLRLLALTLDHRLSPDPASPAAQLREQIVRAVRAEPERWNEATLGKPVEAYCAFIADPKRWGGQACHPAPPPPHPRPHPQPPAPCTHILHPHPAPGALHPAPLHPMHPAPRQVELAIFAEAHQTEISVTDIQSGRADVYGHGAICIHTHIYGHGAIYTYMDMDTVRATAALLHAHATCYMLTCYMHMRPFYMLAVATPTKVRVTRGAATCSSRASTSTPPGMCMCTCIACACGAHAHAHGVLYASWRLFDPVSVEGARTVASAHAAAADAAVAVLAAEQRSAGGFTDQATPVPTMHHGWLALPHRQTPLTLFSVPLRRRRCGCAARRAGISWWATTRQGCTPGRAATRTSCKTAELT